MSPLLLFVLTLAVLTSLFVLIQVGIITTAFERLGVSPSGAVLLLYGCLVGSLVDIPLFRIKVHTTTPSAVPWIYRSLLPCTPLPPTGSTLIAVNVGGCVIPLIFSVLLLRRMPVPPASLAATTFIVAVVGYFSSRTIEGVGVAMPLFVAPVTTALAAVLVDRAHAAPLAYVSGTLGVLLGVDAVKLGQVARTGARVASIGGAGTFDGIFLTGVIAVLLASDI